MKTAAIVWGIGCIVSSGTLGATIELSGGGADVGALLRIPVPAGQLKADPGDAILLVDENGREIPVQVERAALDEKAIELLVVRPAGMGRTLRVGKTRPPEPSPAYWARKDGDRTVSLGTADNGIARYHVGVRKLADHPEHDRANFFHPLVTPSGIVVTDDAPEDHLHHRGLFLAFTKVTWSADGKNLEGNFWHKHETASIAPGTFHYARGGPVCATLAASHDYRIAEQVVLVQDVVARAARVIDQVNVLDVEIRVTAKGGSAELGANFYSCLQLRGAADFNRPDLVFTYADGKPHGDVDKRKETKEDPPFDRWIDETGLVRGKHVGAAVAVHPATPKSRLCYSRGVKGLNLNALYDGPIKLPAGQSLGFRYQVYVHDGTAAEARIDQIAGWFNPGVQAKWRE